MKRNSFTKYVISGESGSLGRKITEQLLEKIQAENQSVTTRTPENLDALIQRGVAVHAADYNDPAALERVYEGSDVLMLSSLAVTKRVPEHRNAINAAKWAGIKHVVYTSTAGIHPQNPTLSASDHIVTEDDLRRCGLGYIISSDHNQTVTSPNQPHGPVASAVQSQWGPPLQRRSSPSGDPEGCGLSGCAKKCALTG